MSWLNPHLALNPHTPLHYPLKSIKEKKHLKEFKGILFIPLKYFHQYNIKSTHTQTKSEHVPGTFVYLYMEKEKLTK